MKGKGTKMVATARSLPSREAKGLPLSEAKGLCHEFFPPGRGPRHTTRAVATCNLRKFRGATTQGAAAHARPSAPRPTSINFVTFQLAGAPLRSITAILRLASQDT